MNKNPSPKKTKCLLLIAAVLLLAAFSAHLNAADPAAASNPDRYELKILTYNICGLPETITSGRELVPMKKRYEYFGKKFREYDIIGLQENFDKDREIIEEKLGQYFVVHGTDTMGYAKIGSGLYTFSRWPITQLLFQEWRESSGFDARSHKGFVAGTTKISDDLLIDVYNLHAQAGGDNREIRLKQFAQLFEAMEKFSFGSGRPIILLGDFNCKHHYDEVMGIIAAHGFTHVKPGLPKVDHIFFNPNGSGWRMESLHAEKIFTERVDGLRFSDHEALEATVAVYRQKD